METRSQDFVHQRPTIQTTTRASPAYLSMLLSLEAVPRLHNIFACVFSFVLLVGFAIVPGAFPVPSSAAAANEAVTIGGFVLVGVGLLGCMLFCYFISHPGTPMFSFLVSSWYVSVQVSWLAIRWRRNYVWLINKIHLPLLQDGLVGVIVSLVAVYRLQGYLFCFVPSYPFPPDLLCFASSLTTCGFPPLYTFFSPLPLSPPK